MIYSLKPKLFIINNWKNLNCKIGLKIIQSYIQIYRTYNIDQAIHYSIEFIKILKFNNCNLNDKFCI